MEVYLIHRRIQDGNDKQHKGDFSLKKRKRPKSDPRNKT